MDYRYIAGTNKIVRRTDAVPVRTRHCSVPSAQWNLLSTASTGTCVYPNRNLVPGAHGSDPRSARPDAIRHPG
eukprot:SAG31_NODE_16115_length_722_cov_1.000000_1_plen_72_part_10